MIHYSLNIDDFNWINGLDVGIPLNLISNIFTNLHYDYDITTSKLLVLQFQLVIIVMEKTDIKML